ncbi:hypothetical protein KX816_18155 [Sphingosinicellaceae bacterium]|nr:hypothetical protein KX816_18155 [Sphingosinicellaceae bacterium]
MSVAHLIPADLANDMAELAEHIAAGRFEAILGDLAAPAGAAACAPGSIRDRIAGAVRGGCGSGTFADHADPVAARLDRLDPAARAVAVFMLLPSAGDHTLRRTTESNFAFVVRLLGSRAVVWHIAGETGDRAELPGWRDAALAVASDALPVAWRYLAAVPDAAGWLGHYFAGGPHPVDDGRYFTVAEADGHVVRDARSGTAVLAGEPAECRRWAARLNRHPVAAMPLRWLIATQRHGAAKHSPTTARLRNPSRAYSHTAG